jgi:hypothetical protein
VTPERFWLNVDVRGQDECWIWTGAINERGYGRAYWSSTMRSHGCHRIAWMLKRGPIPHGMLVLHSCDNPPCCNPDHLRLGTAGDNAKDRVDRGHQPKGASVPISKLTDEDVKMMREMYATKPNTTIIELANTCGVSYHTAYCAIIGETWRHVGTNDSAYIRRPYVGQRVHTAKMTEHQVRSLRLLHKMGWSSGELGILYGLSEHQAWMIGTGRSWRHLTE